MLISNRSARAVVFSDFGHEYISAIHWSSIGTTIYTAHGTVRLMATGFALGHSEYVVEMRFA
ncbi:hypothetical protein [Mesorhizobium sp. A623]